MATINTHLPWKLWRWKGRIRLFLWIGGLDGLEARGRTLHVFGPEPFILARRLLRCFEVLTTELGQEAIPRFVREFGVLGQFTFDH